MAKSNPGIKGVATQGQIVVKTAAREVTVFRIDHSSGSETPVCILRHDAAEPYLEALAKSGRMTTPVVM